MSLPLTPAQMLAQGWVQSVATWKVAHGVEGTAAVRSMATTAVVVEHLGAPLRLTWPALFALESVSKPAKPEMFANVLFAVSQAWDREPWQNDAGLGVDVSTLGALWAAGHVHYTTETFKSARKVHRYNASWIDSVLGEMIRPRSVVDSASHCNLLREAGKAVSQWASPAGRPVFGHALFMGFQRNLKYASSQPKARMEAWTEAFMDVIRRGVVHVPQGATVFQRQTLGANVHNLWDPSDSIVPLEKRLDRLLDILAFLNDSPMKVDDVAVRRHVDRCWEAGVSLPAQDSHHAARMAILAQRHPSLHAEMREHVSAITPPAPSRARFRS